MATRTSFGVWASSLVQVPAVCLPPYRGLALLCCLALIRGMMLDETG